jgi:hypothetical protein
MNRRRSRGRDRGVKLKNFLPVLITVLLGLYSCDLFEYGQLGGADKTYTFTPGDEEFEERLSFLSAVWYSHYASIGRLDGYRIGKWKDFKRLFVDNGKAVLFPGFDPASPRTYSAGDAPRDDDYFVFYDDTVYGQDDNNTGGNGGWGTLSTRYIGIVRAVNIFNEDPDRGAVIIEYLKGCAPAWHNDIRNGGRPFFGIYYRVLKPDIVQMANAVNLAALYNGEKYYTETAALDEAIALNTIENEAEFISWGVVIPQDREK